MVRAARDRTIGEMATQNRKPRDERLVLIRRGQTRTWKSESRRHSSNAALGFPERVSAIGDRPERMTDSHRFRVGTGATPRAAVADLLPEREGETVEWIEGLEGFSRRADPADYDEAVTREVTLIYPSPPDERWRIVVTPREDTWRAEVTGTRRIDP